MYNSFIMANLKYCPLIWMFCGKDANDKINKRTACFVLMTMIHLLLNYSLKAMKELSMFRIYKSFVRLEALFLIGARNTCLTFLPKYAGVSC